MDTDDENNECNFHEMGLDDRLLKAIAKLRWESPTLIQRHAIPLLLEGKDVLIRARTGSGKTAAFAVPLIQKILTSKPESTHQQTKALILAPSKELCHQIHAVIRQLTVKCSREIHCIDISPQVAMSTQKPLLMEKPDIVISTPARALQFIKSGHINLRKSMEMLVIDEADLVFSFGYENELKELVTHLPKIYQATLASATLSDDVKSLKNLVLHNPVSLKLEEPDIAPESQLAHYYLNAEENDKASILYALLKLNLIRGKTIIFVNTVDKCYKLKLYLEQFKISTCVLNSELPATIRCHAVHQFNQGVYETIIASDEKALDAPQAMDKQQKSRRRKDKESGVSRGIDFQRVSNVINFDFPLDVDAYVHRAGRTARGTYQGSVLSFVSINEQPVFKKVEKHLCKCLNTKSTMKVYQLKLDEIEGFKYRSNDAWRAVTRIAVREARLKEIKQEIFNCEKLKGYFEDNPTDLQILRHDKALHTVRIQQHLADVPDYMVPPTLKNVAGVVQNNTKKRKDHYKTTTNMKKFQKRKQNPLLSMEFDGLTQNKKKKRKHND